MSISAIPEDYRITAEDEDKGYKIFVRDYGIGDGPQPTAEEIRLAEILMDAGHIHRKTGKWPTVGEVLARWKQEALEREQKRIASWQDTGTITAYDFACYEERVAQNNFEGPFMRFMTVAVDLKIASPTVASPTVGEVRAEIKRRAAR